MCVADTLEAPWVELKSVMVSHGTVAPIDDMVTVEVGKVWMSLLGDRVSDMSVP